MPAGRGFHHAWRNLISFRTEEITKSFSLEQQSWWKQDGKTRSWPTLLQPSDPTAITDARCGSNILNLQQPETAYQYNQFITTVGKGEIAHNEQFLLFPQCFLPFWKPFSHFHQTKNCCLQTLSVWKSLKFVVWERVKHSHS